MVTVTRTGRTKRDLARIPDLPAGKSEKSEKASQKKLCLRLRSYEKQELQEMGREAGKDCSGRGNGWHQGLAAGMINLGESR